MFPWNKITHLNKMHNIYYICSPALKCLRPAAAGEHGPLRGSAAGFAPQQAPPVVVPGSSSSGEAVS